MFGLLFVVGGMIGASYAAVPLYRIFCQVTGFGGTPNLASGPSATVSERMMSVRFDSTVNGLDWGFQPVQREVRIRVGETMVAYYRARNNSDQPLVGSATFNVTPLKAGSYFSKIECFCFTEQRLEPGQSIDMPVSFFIEPAIAENVNLDDVRTITLSYTFYPVKKKAGDAKRNVSRLERRASAEGVN
jgi:cytochrome c oxidase assembly protein subunit 11